MRRNSYRVIARRLLGRRGTFALRNFVSSVAFYLGLRDDPRRKPEGISAMVITYNDEDWVEPSLLSIKDLVDEYIVFDTSADNTPSIIARLRDEVGLNVRYHRILPGSLSDIRNNVLSRISYRWVLVWEADFILREDSVGIIKDLVESLDPRRHYLIYWPWIQLCGDIYHMCSDKPYHIEHWLYTHSERLRYRDINVNGSTQELLITPIWLYKAIYVDKILGVHLIGTRKPARLAHKILWHRYKSEFYNVARKGISYEEFASMKAREVYGTGDLEEVGCRIIEEMVRKLPRYDASKYGELPSLARRYWEGRNSRWCGGGSRS